MSQDNVFYCTLSLTLSSADGNPPFTLLVSATGAVVAPDGSVQEVGSNGSEAYELSVAVPLAYGQSKDGLKRALVAEIQSGYQAPDFSADVVFLPDL